MPTPPDIHSQPPGPGVDAEGRAVLDPTKNVLALVTAAVARIDDIQKLSAEYTEKTRVLTSMYEDKLRVQESARIDAIRAVDVGAVARAAEVSAAQAATLAAQVQTSAEAMRAQVAAAAQAAAVALAAALEPIQKSIDDLRKTQYEQQGDRAARLDSRDLTRFQHESTQFNTSIPIALVGLALAIITVGILIATHH